MIKQALSAQKLSSELKKIASHEHKKILQRFFKTGPGEYGEGDVFLGIKVPVLRQFVKKNKEMTLSETKKLIQSKYHEERMVGLLLLVAKYSKADFVSREKIFQLYVQNTKHINNWDLVDLTAPHIVGAHVFGKDNQILFTFAKSKLLWERRIAMLAVFFHIRHNDFKEALALAKILIRDQHDLMHKAVGWMLREIGKRDLETEENFLQEFCTIMPRTMLRYAVEKFPETKRKKYLGAKAVLQKRKVV